MHSESHLSSRTSPQPALFVPHGAPTFALAPGAAGAALQRLGTRLQRPRAIVMASAHWSTAQPRVGAAPRPVTIHDFRGFPPELYALRYAATGCPEAAAEVQHALRTAGFAAELAAAQGLDHGAWIPLRLMFPDADVPVIPLSIQHHQDAAHHLRVGRALAPLARQGFLVIGSGNLTHNLHDFMRLRTTGQADLSYVRPFAEWIWQQLQAGNESALLDYRRAAPGAVQAHPTDDHLLPFYVALGAAGPGALATRVHAGIDEGLLAMDTYLFQAQELPS